MFAARRDGEEVPDLQVIDSEETLALCSSASTDFDDVVLSERVDLVSTTLSPQPPRMPLREELMTLGVEAVFKAKGVGWNKVRKNRKKRRKEKNKKKKSLAVNVKNCLDQNSLNCCVRSPSPTESVGIHNEGVPDNGNLSRSDQTDVINIDSDMEALTYEEYTDHLFKCYNKKRETYLHQFLELEVERDEKADGRRSLPRRRIFTQELGAPKKRSEPHPQQSPRGLKVAESDTKDPGSNAITIPKKCSEPHPQQSPRGLRVAESDRKDTKTNTITIHEDGAQSAPNVMCDQVVDKIIESSVAMDNNGISSCSAVPEDSIIDTSTTGVAMSSTTSTPTEKEKKRRRKKKKNDKGRKNTIGLAVVKEEPISVNAFRKTSLMDAHFSAEEKTIVHKNSLSPRKDVIMPSRNRNRNQIRKGRLSAEEEIIRSKKLPYGKSKSIPTTRSRSHSSEDRRDDSRPGAAALSEDERDAASVYSHVSKTSEDLSEDDTKMPAKRTLTPKASGAGKGLLLEPSPEMRRQLSIDLSRQIMKEHGFSSEGSCSGSVNSKKKTAKAEKGGLPKEDDENNRAGKALSLKPSPEMKRQQSIGLSRQIMKEYGFPSEGSGSESVTPKNKPSKVVAKGRLLKKDEKELHSHENQVQRVSSVVESVKVLSLEKTREMKRQRSVDLSRNIMKQAGFSDILGGKKESDTNTDADVKRTSSPLAFMSVGSETSSLLSYHSCRSNGSKQNNEGSSLKTKNLEDENEVEIQYEEVMSFPTFSMNSTASDDNSNQAEETKAACSSTAATTAKQQNISRKATLSPSQSISKSFSFQTCTSDFLSIKSAASQMSNEDIEQSVCYTVGQLTRINSILDNADSLSSCTSTSTTDRDALYFATQSKREIAALAQTLERQIYEEKGSPKFDVAPSGTTTDDEVENGGVEKWNSFSFESPKSSVSKATQSIAGSSSMDRLILEVNELCNRIEDRIDNIVNDSKNKR